MTFHSTDGICLHPISPMSNQCPFPCVQNYPNLNLVGVFLPPMNDVFFCKSIFVHHISQGFGGFRKSQTVLSSLGIQSPCERMIGVYNHLHDAKYLAFMLPFSPGSLGVKPPPFFKQQNLLSNLVSLRTAHYISLLHSIPCMVFLPT